MRTRIALTTAVAVSLIPVGLLISTSGGSSSAAAARTRHEAATRSVKPVRAEKSAPGGTGRHGAAANNVVAAFSEAINNQQAVLANKQIPAAPAAPAPAAPAPAAPAPAPAPAAPAPAAPAAPAVASSGGGWSGPWACIAQHESSGNPAANTGNGFYGGLQFTMQTWQAFGGAGSPVNASIAQQEAVANNVLAAQGWGAWPNTSRMCGL